jgi:predicted GNAT family N-acyltransferase
LEIIFKVYPLNSPEMLEQAFAIRRTVFVEEQAVAPEEEYDEYEEESRHYLAFMEDIPVGTARWRQTDKGIKLERFAVLREFRGQGVGELLLRQVLEDVKILRRNIPEGEVYLHAQVQVIPFYEKSGFEVKGEEFLEAGIRHKRMIWNERS